MTLASHPTALDRALEQIDAIADRLFAGWHVPGVAYGVTLGGRLVHSRGLGTLRVGEDATPDARSVFRIASMTKSFTAAAVLHLRDEGRLGLDDRIARYVPELASLRYPTADSPPITIRHLLTMTAGFPTDDPWGDRQQSLELEAFRRLLAGGLSFAWAPGTRFEYSNTGYGILGRLITNVAGREYRDVVRERLLEPLGMGSTGYAEEEFDAARLAKGYLWRNDRYLDEPSDAYGALAAMGGLFTTVEDLATWIGFFVDAFPARDDPEGSYPLRRASRREMQQPLVDAGTRLSHVTPDAMPDLERMAYGYGLFIVDDVRFGRIAGHSGGYPGFGSNMRWHSASGLGVIALTNHRYGPAGLLARDALWELLKAEAAPVRRTRPNTATQAARAAVESLLAAWNDDAAADLFAMNVDLDEPIAERRAFLATLRDRHGVLTPRRGHAGGVAHALPPRLVAQRRQGRPGQSRDPALARAPAEGPDVRRHLGPGAVAGTADRGRGHHRRAAAAGRGSPCGGRLALRADARHGCRRRRDRPVDAGRGGEIRSDLHGPRDRRRR